MRVLESYTFTPGPRRAGTITIPEVLKLEDITHIWNSTRGALVFDVKNSQYSIVNVVVAGGSTTLTIETDTSTMDAGDKLQILIYDPFPDKPGTSSSTDGANDAFGRLRVSEPFTLADYKKVYGLSVDFLSDTAGAGSGVAFVANQAASRLTVDTGATDYVVHQSRMYHPYQPGKSQLILCSFKLNGAQENAEKRIGYFDDRNGTFLLYDGAGALSFVERRYVTGSPVDFSVAQANWNADRCDGTGPSGFNIATANTQLMFIDFQWLGVGRVRVGFVHDGSYVVAHEFYHSNILSTVYWSNPALPVRAEIRNTGALAAPATLDFICASVQAEGGYDEAGLDFAANTAVRTIGNPPNTLPVMAIRLSNTFNTYPNRVTIRLSQAEGYSGTGGYRLDIYRLASHTQLTSTDVGGIVWTQANSGSAVEYSTNPTTYTPAATDQLLDSFFVAAGGGTSRPTSTGATDPATARLSYIAQNIASTDSQAFLVLATSLGNGATAAVSMQWRELQ
jgi:hypothetical protein